MGNITDLENRHASSGADDFGKSSPLCFSSLIANRAGYEAFELIPGF
jgi:hypothetical protein